MSIPASVKNYLASKGGQYKVRKGEPGITLLETAAQAQIPPHQLARASLLKDGMAYLMVVFPANHRLELERLNMALKRNFRACTAEDFGNLFSDCDPLALPPLATPYGVKAIVDKRLEALEEVYFASGHHGTFIRAAMEDFVRLQDGAVRGRAISVPMTTDAPEGSREDFKTRVEQVNKLPPMPGIATQLLQVRSNPYAHVSELSAIIEQDPSLTAQVMRYATSPFYGYQGKLQSVDQAIARVLGMDFVMDFAFGLSLGKSFRIPKSGPLGLESFWNHAMHSAALTQALCNRIEFSQRPSPGMAYMAGLLHNFGFLLLGHLFPEQFDRLNHALAADDERPIEELEREVLGVTHTELGLWLMDAWDMPKEIIEAVREHHNPDYRSDYAVYPNLVYLANRLLKRFGIGDAESLDLPAELLANLGLSVVEAEAALGTVAELREGLEFMAHKMAA